ncbi:DUF4347 domain-containing protein [Thiotrichales bacterium 19X7-9]|nr:DUF4347 domain-containing protein [Thiotrichales bacterium 19X7-9]
MTKVNKTLGLGGIVKKIKKVKNKNLRKSRLSTAINLILAPKEDFDLDKSIYISTIRQALEPRYMFDGAAVGTVDLADDISENEQNEVLQALDINGNADAAESLLEQIGANDHNLTKDYSVYKEVVIFDSRVKDPHTLIKDISRKSSVEIIDIDKNGVNEIARILSKYDNLDAVHIISHGNQGELYLGDAILNSDSLSFYKNQLTNWGQSLSSNGDLLFYGCNVAEGSKGMTFIDALKSYTNADIAASTDITGGDYLGGNSILEYQGGPIEYDYLLDFSNWNNILALPNASEMFNINGDATIINDATREIRLTEAFNDQAGSAMSKLTLDFSNDFTFDFDVRFSVTNNDAGADGVAFVLHNDPDGPSAIGGGGGGFGVLGIEDGITLEFDTHTNAPGTFDPASGEDHSHLFDTDLPNDLSNVIAGSTVQTTVQNLEDAQWYNVTITWVASTSTFSYSLEDSGSTVLLSDSFVNTTIAADYFGGSTDIYFGFGAATGSSVNEQTIILNDLTATIKPALDLDGSDSSNDYTTNYTENSPTAVLLSNFGATGGVININSTTLNSATVTLLDYETLDDFRVDPSQAAAITSSGINWSTNVVGDDKVLTFTTVSGSPTNADYQTALNAVEYISTSDDFITTTKTFQYQITNDLSQISNISTTTLNITEINDPPTLFSDISTQVGSDIYGALGDEVGHAVAITDDGSRIAFSSLDNYVSVYDWDGSSWNQVGSNILEEAADDLVGHSITFNNDGSRIAVSAINNDDNGSNSGHVRIYEFNGTAWVQLGGDIDGEAANDQSGRSISLSSDGNTIAIGAAQNSQVAIWAGHVRVYEYNGTAWVQKGADLDGATLTELKGWSVSLSDNGDILAIGSLGAGSNGFVSIYQYNGTAWVQLGSDIVGEAVNDQSGGSVSLSSDGMRVAIGAPENDDNGLGSGHVRVYDWNGSAWVQVGNDIDGEAEDDQSGWSVSLSSDGNTL